MGEDLASIIHLFDFVRVLRLCSQIVFPLLIDEI